MTFAPLLRAFAAAAALLAVAALPAGEAPARPAPETSSRTERRPADFRLTPDPTLPNVLLLGDSISIGYTRTVRQLLAGKANVFRPVNTNGTAENCSDTGYGLANLDRWLALQPKWQVIHFNWGLHDLKHMQAGKPSSDPAAPALRSVEDYRANLEKIVARLQRTGARLIFATTTPVPVGANQPFRQPEAPPRYNATAVAVMQTAGVRVNDLFAFAASELSRWQQPRNVHFTEAGSEQLARQVAAAITAELARRP
jgi:lysophospholipase L1-like esterase